MAVVERVRGMINEASDARLGPRSSPRVARRLNGFDSEIDHTLEALKVVEVMSALIACGKTILLQLNVLLKKCNGEKEKNRPRGGALSYGKRSHPG